MSVEQQQHDLVERLALEAAEAVRRRRTAIESGGAGNLNAITIEIELANGGDVLDVQTYLAWRDVVRNARRAG